MIKIPINLKEAERVREFLDYLRLQWDFEDFWRSKGSFRADGRFVEVVTGRPKGLTGENGQLTFTMTWKLDGTLADITAEAEEGAPHDWQTRVREWVASALVETINAQRERHFSNHTFAYVGELLDGEYYIGGFRLAPAVYPDVIDYLGESVVYLGLHADGVDRTQAHQLGRIQAERMASLLSCFLHVGFYTIPNEGRWVLTGGNQSARHPLGFCPKAPPPTEMPPKGHLCRLGTVQPVDRSQLLAPAWDGSGLKPPSDIRELFRCYSRLASDEQEAFLGAAGLFRIGLAAGGMFPSVHLAYSVAAVDALVRGKRHRQEAFVSLVRELCPEAPEDRLRYAYGQIRSAHFHGGALPGGELEPIEIGPFRGPDGLNGRNIRRSVAVLMWNTLIRWLLARTSNLR